MSDWISRSGALTEEETLNNGIIFGNVFTGLGYDINTISALAGNANAESGINPERVEAGGGGGYGIFQWTPKSDLISACGSLGLSPYTNGSIQCQCLHGELVTLKNQWYTTRAFITPYLSSGATYDMIGITAEQFKNNSMGWNPDKLTVLFMVAYERPSRDPNVNHVDRRKEYANYWYQYYTGNPPTPTPPEPSKPDKQLVAIFSQSKRGLHKM